MSTVFGGMAASLDGYIASTDGDLGWLNSAMVKGEDYGFSETMKRTGAYIIGANTYREMVKNGMGGGDAKTPTFILTHDSSMGSKHVRTHAGDLSDLLSEARAATDKDICVYGGGNILSQFIDRGLLDELTISVIPVVLGSGVPFFTGIGSMKRLTLVESKSFSSGIVVLKYTRKEP